MTDDDATLTVVLDFYQIGRSDPGRYERLCRALLANEQIVGLIEAAVNKSIRRPHRPGSPIRTLSIAKQLARRFTVFKEKYAKTKAGRNRTLTELLDDFFAQLPARLKLRVNSTSSGHRPEMSVSSLYRLIRDGGTLVRQEADLRRLYAAISSHPSAGVSRARIRNLLRDARSGKFSDNELRSLADSYELSRQIGSRALMNWHARPLIEK